MGLFDIFKKKPEPEVKAPEAPKKTKKKSPKDEATERGEPYVAILSMDLNPDDINAGAFELDWNDKFIANLVRAGYQMKPTDTDSEIVDRWFQTVCRNVVLETYEQEEAINNSSRFTQSRDLGNGRREHS